MNEDQNRRGDESQLDRLSQSERKCLEFVDQGLNSKEIGRAMDRSPNSVDTWIRSAVRKLGARNRHHAAKMVANALAGLKNEVVTPVSILRYQESHLPPGAVPGESKASAGEGNGPADLLHDRLLGAESTDSGKGGSWIEPSHPLAKFFGGDNRNSPAQNILLIVGIAILISIAFTLVMSSYLGLSRLLSTP